MVKRGSTAGATPPPAANEPPFHYAAVIYASGEIPEIVESIGRRRLRVIDPRGKEGRELLCRGRVKLWPAPGEQGKRRPVDEVLDALLRDAREQVRRGVDSGADARQVRDCRRRLESIERSRTFYRTGTKRDH